MNHIAPAPFVASQLAAPLPESGLAWLDAARRENRDAFAAQGLPDNRDEDWRYTALRALAQRSYAVGDAQARDRVVDADALSLRDIEGPRLVFVNGVHRADLSRVDALPDGVSLRSLAQALHEDAEPLRFLLDRRHREPGDAFTRLNAAFAADGVVLRVAPGVRVPTPVQLIFIGAPAGADVAWHVRNVVELGDGAALTLVERHFDTAAHARFATVVADHLVHAGAWLDHVLVQTTDEAATLIHRNRLELDADAEARVDVLELGGALARLDLDASLRGDRAHLRTRGVFAPRGRQHIDTRLLIRHLGRDTRSAADWRGVADQRARGVFRGIIEVAQGADGTDAALSSRNLLLSAQAEIDTRPELDILTDAVKAAHGATVGQLDERALFYLRSRGIPSAQARAMLTAAFCESVFDDPAVPALREHLAALLAVRLRQGEEG